jgi:hypothetical protein
MVLGLHLRARSLLAAYVLSMHTCVKGVRHPLALPVAVTLATASKSATEQEDANGWQGIAEGRLPGSRNVR